MSTLYHDFLRNSEWLENLEENQSTRVTSSSHNIVMEDSLREVQLRTLDQLKGFLSKTFGPMGSNTMILTGNTPETIKAEYSKDGHKVLKNVRYSSPIEMTIQSEIEDITRHVELQVGDGTTSATLLSAIIFKYINAIMQRYDNEPPYSVIRTFKEVVSDIQNAIKSASNDMTLDDIRDICMISTNGDEEITRDIMTIYEKFGLDVSIDVSISNTTESMVKDYEGMTLNEGYSDPAYINNASKGICELYNPRIYSFQDPVDTPYMVSLFEKIIMDNIIDPLQKKKLENVKPTVILAPILSRDMSAMLESIIQMMYQYNGTMVSQRPPLLVITNITKVDEGVYYDIAKLCGCKAIRKYIDPNLQKIDEKKGLAASLENVTSFYGEVEQIISDEQKTRFINPKLAYEMKDGEMKKSSTYESILSFLKSELKSAQDNNEGVGKTSLLKKRIAALEANSAEYLIGGITIADRDSKRDLVEDAVKNCRSACTDGWGWAANFEGLRASYSVMKALPKVVDSHTALHNDIASAIFRAYHEISKELYMTVVQEKEALELVTESLDNGMPMNLYEQRFTGDVKCSIMTDIKILEAISKIITIMVTSNQCIVQNPTANTY